MRSFDAERAASPGVCSCGDEASDELPLQQLTVDDASEQARLGARRDSASTEGAPPLHTAAIALHQSLFISGEAAASVTVPAVCRTSKARPTRCFGCSTTQTGRRTRRGRHSAEKSTSLRAASAATRGSPPWLLQPSIPRRRTAMCGTVWPLRAASSASTASLRSASVGIHSAPAAGRRVGVVAVVADHKVEADVTQRGERYGPLPRSLLEQRQPPHPTAAAAAAAADG